MFLSDDTAKTEKGPRMRRSDHGGQADAELLRASASDPEAFGVFYDRHVDALLGYFYRRTACAEMAADLTAETFAAAFSSRRRYRDTGVPARAWLFGIARRELGTALRRQRVADRARKRLAIPRVALDDASIEHIESLMDLRPLAASMARAFDALTPGLAAAVTLRVSQELPYDEVARRLGCSPGAARVRVARGLARLEQLLEVAQ